MKLPVGFGDGVGVQQTVGAGLRRALRSTGSQALAIDAIYIRVPELLFEVALQQRHHFALPLRPDVQTLIITGSSCGLRKMIAGCDP
jgi:hypothetical protein